MDKCIILPNITQAFYRKNLFSVNTLRILEEEIITTGPRFKQILDFIGLTQTAAAQKFMISKAYVSHIVNNRSKLTVEILAEIKKSCPSVSTDWLLYGEGAMLLPNHPLLDRVMEPGNNYTADPLSGLRRELDEMRERILELEAWRRTVDGHG